MTEISSHERKNTPSFSLNQNEIEFISDMVARGRFGNRTEVVRAGLRLLEDYENNMKLRRLRVKIEEASVAIAEGKGISYDNGTALAQDVIAQGEKRLNRDN